MEKARGYPEIVSIHRFARVLPTAVALLLAGCGTGPTTAMGGQPVDLIATGGRLAVTLTAAESMVPYHSGTRWAMTYNGTAIGPTLRVHPGDQLSITLVNHLAKPTSLHTHGLHVDPAVDNPFLMVDPGKSHTYTYDIPRDQQAGTFWYHPHVHELTAEQVASGLVGAIVVQDETDDALAAVSTDSVLVVNDPPLVTANPWGRGMGMMGGGSGVDMMTATLGRTGPRLLTNGQDGVALPSTTGKLDRVHVVNATSSTRLRLSYSGSAMQVLAATGGRLPAPVTVDSVELAPGERTELVLAGGGQLTGQPLSNERDGGPVGNAEVIATVPSGASTDLTTLPTALTADTRDLFAAGVKVAKIRTITLDGHMNPSIDGRLFDPNVVNFEAAKGTVEEWRIVSNSPMHHPIHLHTWPMQVQGRPGWQDVVTVAPYQQVVVRVAFEDFAGTTVLHCHILDHEDTGMMAVIKVT